LFYAIDRLPAFTAVEASAAAGEIPLHALKNLRLLYDKIADDARLTALTLECCNAIAAGKGKSDCGKAFFDKVELQRFHALLILLSYEAAKANYARAHYAQADFAVVWRDLAHWAQFYLDLYGDLRFDDNVFGWYFLHIAGELIQLGRLQFQLPDFYREEADLAPFVETGDPIIDFHIYAGDPLDVDACRDSLRQLKAWLKINKPDYDFRAIISHSWLFDAELAQFLPEKSNIRKFWTLGHLVSTPQESDVLWRIFAGRDPESVSTPNALQKKILDFYRHGGKLHYGYLVIPHDEFEA